MTHFRRSATLCSLLILAALIACSPAPRLEGQVLDAASGQPLSGAVIVVGTQTAIADGDGHYRLQVAPGDAVAVFSAPGYVSETVPFAVAERSRRLRQDLQMQPRVLKGRTIAEDTSEPVGGLTVALGNASSLTDADGHFALVAREPGDLIISGAGVLTRTLAATEVAALFLEPDGTPVAGAEVSIGPARTRTNAEGRYALRFTAVGQPILVSSPGHHPVPEVVYEGQADYSVELIPYVAELRVTEETTGLGLSGVTVSRAGQPVALTDENGLASVRAAPESTLELAATGYLTTTITFAGQVEPMAVALRPTLLQGHIRDGDTGEAVARALVQVFSGGEGSPQLVRTDADGQYLIPDATDVTRLFIKAPGYDRQSVDVTHLGQLDITLEPFAAQGIYIPFGLLSLPDRVYALLDMVDRSPSLNAVVIDVKGDWAQIAWPSEYPVAREIGAYVPGPMDIADVLKAAHERGIYTIARIVTFKDRVLAEGKPEWAVHTQSGALYLDGENLPWSDPFRPEVWDYNIAIALEAIEKGFDEVQFDYLRFPSEGRVSDRVYSQEATFETRTAAMAGFCEAAYAAIEPTPAFVSADIFGLTVWVDPGRDMGIGQRVDDIAAHMDYISPMLYPQTFNPATLQSLGISDVELYPYETLYYSVQKTLARTATKVRPWLQHYSGRYTYGVDELLRQRKGAEDGGATGWLFWNAKGSYLEEIFGADPYSQMAVIPVPPEESEP